MSNPYFAFRQFTIRHDRCAMKVGTDGVLLGAWANVGSAQRILDIGTGTGLIAIMMAQRCGALIDALEIDETASIQAVENATACPWKERITIIHRSFQQWARTTDERYDLVVCNPPFFRNALRPTSQSRSAARHDTGLSFEELLHYGSTILTDAGRLSVIIPAGMTEKFIRMACFNGMHVSRLLHVQPLPGRAFARSLIELSKARKAVYEEDILIIRESDRITYTGAYRQLTQDFYLPTEK